VSLLGLFIAKDLLMFQWFWRLLYESNPAEFRSAFGLAESLDPRYPDANRIGRMQYVCCCCDLEGSSPSDGRYYSDSWRLPT